MFYPIGTIFLSLSAVPSALSFEWSRPDWTYYAATIGSGAFSIGVANVFWSVGVQKLGPGRTANFGNLVPVLAFLLSYIVLDERVLPIQVIGAAVTIGGVWLARR